MAIPALLLKSSKLALKLLQCFHFVTDDLQNSHNTSKNSQDHWIFKLLVSINFKGENKICHQLFIL